MPLRLWRRRPAGDPLGEGVWRRAHDRFRRGVDRYHQMLEQVPEGPWTAGLEQAGAALAARLDEVREVCVQAQRLAPSEGTDVPAGAGGAFLDVHRALSRGATLAAQAAEGVAMARVALRAAPEEVPGRVSAAERGAEQAGTQVDRARERLRPLMDAHRQ